MSQDFLVEPDLNFIKDMQRAGGDSLKKCFQCATCSVVCNATPDDHPFPRKEMIWAQWGQKDKLMSDPDVWLCHQCNDCTENCPRGAKPGDVLAAIRNASFKGYAFPGFMGSMLARPLYLPFLLAIPIIILASVISIFGNWSPTGEIEFAKFYPELAVDGTFVGTWILAGIALFVGLNRFWKAMTKEHGEKGLMGAPIPNLIAALPVILKHDRFKECDQTDRTTGHMGVFYGFVGAFVTTAFVMSGYWVFGIHTPYAQFSHVKILGNLSGAAIIVGGILLLVRRVSFKKMASGYYDWSLIILVIGLGVTGLATELIRLAGAASAAYTSYFIHLMFVFYLFLYLPYSKMAHLAYRTVGMTFARTAQRDLLKEDEVVA